MPANDYCAIDFGTSNSAVAIPHRDGMRLIELEPGFQSMPTAVFYNAEDESRRFGREAVTAYVDGYDGRLMRSIKSILGSDLIEQSSEIGHGISIKYIDVVIGYLRHLKNVAEAQHGGRLSRVVIGRPVRFVDHDETRDAKAMKSLDTAARAAGFTDVAFQFEPIAAALDYESTVREEQIVLVADIGGGTSDFSLVRVGPARHGRLERQDDILATHGIHVAGTDFDQSVNLAAIMPQLGFGSLGPQDRRVPGKVYFDLATWHLINTVYTPGRVAELARMKTFYADPRQHARLMTVVTEHLGHGLIARAEAAKIAVAGGVAATIDLSLLEPGLAVTLAETDAIDAAGADFDRIAAAADDTLTQAGLARSQVTALYFTGGSTGLKPLSDRIAARFPAARVMRGDRFASVAQGLGIHATRVFGRGG